MLVRVINPNSTVSCTEALSRAAEPFRAADMTIECETVHEGPESISSMTDYALAQSSVVQYLTHQQKPANALVIACFSDPSLSAAKEIVSCPCFGLGEAGVLAAMQRGMSFGIIALSEASVERQRRKISKLGLCSRYAGSRPVSLSVPELADTKRTVEAMVEAGNLLKSRDNADAIIMGCAGMADYRQTIEDRLQIPVIEPGQAAVAVATTAARQGW